MKMINLECPKCNAPLEVDENREFTFCPFCGAKIMLDDEAIINKYDISFTNKTGVDKTRIKEENKTNRQKEYNESRLKMEEIEIRKRELELEEKKFQASHPIKTLLSDPGFYGGVLLIIFIIYMLILLPYIE